MRNLLYRGEMAELLEMSKSQIRFYEKKGLIHPKKDDKAYTMYSFKELDALELVLLLKDLNKPIEAIKKIIKDESTYDYLTLLEEADCQIDEDILRLQKKKKMLAQRMRTLKTDDINVAQVKTFDKRTLYLIHDADSLQNIKGVYDLLKDHGVRYLDYENELYVLTLEGKEHFGFMYLDSEFKGPGVSKFILDQGQYYTWVFSYTYHEPFAVYEDLFLQSAKAAGVTLVGPQIFIDHFGRKFHEKDRQVATLQARILKDPDNKIV